MSEPLRLDERIGTMVWGFDAPEHKAEVRRMAKEAKALFDERDSLKEQLAKSQAGAMREFESHQETIGKLDAMRVERNTQSAHLAEMGRELRAVEEQNAALRAALAQCTEAASAIAGYFENSGRAQSKGSPAYSEVFMWSLVVPQLDRIGAAARKALGVDHG